MTETTNEIKLRGKIIDLSEITTGEGKRGRWESRLLTLEYQSGKYTTRIRCCVWDHMCLQFQLQDDVCLWLSCEVRKSNLNPELFYNSISVYKAVNFTTSSLVFSIVHKKNISP